MKTNLCMQAHVCSCPLTSVCTVCTICGRSVYVVLMYVLHRQAPTNILHLCNSHAHASKSRTLQNSMRLVRVLTSSSQVLLKILRDLCERSRFKINCSQFVPYMRVQL